MAIAIVLACWACWAGVAIYMINGAREQAPRNCATGTISVDRERSQPGRMS